MMSRRPGIVIALILVVVVVGIDWSISVPLDPYRAPDPMAFGSMSGPSGAICSFAPGLANDSDRR